MLQSRVFFLFGWILFVAGFCSSQKGIGLHFSTLLGTCLTGRITHACTVITGVASGLFMYYSPVCSITEALSCR